MAMPRRSTEPWHASREIAFDPCSRAHSYKAIPVARVSALAIGLAAYKAWCWCSSTIEHIGLCPNIYLYPLGMLEIFKILLKLCKYENG